MSLRTIIPAVLLAVVATAVADDAQKPLGVSSSSRIINDELHRKLSDILAKHKVPGYALAVVRPDAATPVEFANWGNATEDGRPMASNSTLTLASVSKHFAATALGLLIDDFKHGRNVTVLPAGLHELTWSSKLKNVLPDWSAADQDIYQHLTLRDALSHVSGFPRHDSVYTRGETMDTLLEKMAHLRPARELREDWSYVNLFYMLTSKIVARYSGQSFPDFVSARIFTPVGMSSTTYLSSAGEIAGTAVHSFTKEGRRIPTWLTDADVALAGAGGVVSSTRDLSRWLTFLLGHGDKDTKKAIPVDVVQEVMSPQSLLRGAEARRILPMNGTLTYGLGWFQWVYQGHRGVHHTGSVNGIATALAMFPDDGFGIAMLCNGDSQAAANAEILFNIANAVFNIKSEVRQFDQPRATRPSPVIQNLGVPVEDLADTYTDAAYGSLTLCARSSSSAHCRAVLDVFAATAKLEDDTLYAVWPRFWNGHLRVRPAAGVFEPTSLFPAGYGRNTSAFEMLTDAEASVEFDVGDDGSVRGMGVRWEDFPERSEGSIEERAQVWFRRIGA